MDDEQREIEEKRNILHQLIENTDDEIDLDTALDMLKKLPVPD